MLSKIILVEIVLKNRVKLLIIVGLKDQMKSMILPSM